ncbi:glycosyltransferase [uncultured Algibacter sp.]|uniref:glycosyltransferase family 2 protein n=1 Tax=uncultured Algibacter sp. TaxID=298659 RepID=UPI00262F076D|nr:glycosyltransferase [uncultured Algibacter sp.]
MAPILSIVIPVYNVSEYISKCVHSCFDQNVNKKSYEIIIVNDGSTDNSLKICKTLQIQFPEITIVSQENRGLSGARNTGLHYSNGKYVWFVDSDDWIESNKLKTILQELEQNMDILWLGHDVYHKNKVINEFVPNATKQLISGEDLFANHLNNLFFIWKFIYKKKFLESNRLLFMEGILYEDLEFTPRALLKAEKCITLPSVCYHYLVREGSIVTNVKPKNIQNRFSILNELTKLLDENTASELYRSTLSKVIIHTAESSFDLAAKSGVEISDEIINVIDKLVSNKKLKFQISKKLLLININPRLYYFFINKSYKFYRVFSN